MEKNFQILRIEELKLNPVVGTNHLEQGLPGARRINSSGPEHDCEGSSRKYIQSSSNQIINSIESEGVSCQINSETSVVSSDKCQELPRIY